VRGGGVAFVVVEEDRLDLKAAGGAWITGAG